MAEHLDSALDNRHSCLCSSRWHWAVGRGLRDRRDQGLLPARPAPPSVGRAGCGWPSGAASITRAGSTATPAPPDEALLPCPSAAPHPASGQAERLMDRFSARRGRGQFGERWAIDRLGLRLASVSTCIPAPCSTPSRDRSIVPSSSSGAWARWRIGIPTVPPSDCSSGAQ